LTSSRKRGSPTLWASTSVAGAGTWPTCSRSAQRWARWSSRAPGRSTSVSVTSRVNGSHSRPPRSMAVPATSSGSVPATVSSTNQPAPSWRPAVTRPTHPVTARVSQASTSGATVSHGCFSSTPLT
jgi:hypothetical protein